MGWNGSNRTWSRYETVYGVLAALATPLVLSVHSIVSFDFATSLVPGWHSTIFPPYFVAGAVFSGFAMVTTLLIPVRKVMHLEGYITIQHLDNMCKITLLTGSIVGLSYLTELFIGFYSGNPNEIFVILNRMLGPYAWAYWVMFSCNALIPQLFWFKAFRTRIPLILKLCILVNVGMWFERFVIIVTGLHRDYLPSSWAMFIPTLTDVGLLVGSFGLPGLIAGRMSADTFTELVKQIVPAGRAGTPEEVAAVVRFLCSDAASYVNGQVIGVNGAMA